MLPSVLKSIVPTLSAGKFFSFVQVPGAAAQAWVDPRIIAEISDALRKTVRNLVELCFFMINPLKIISGCKFIYTFLNLWLLIQNRFFRSKAGFIRSMLARAVLLCSYNSILPDSPLILIKTGLLTCHLFIMVTSLQIIYFNTMKNYH